MVLYRFKSIVFFSALWALVVMQLIWPSRGRSNDALRETAVVKAVRKVSPVVVNISSEVEVRERANPFSGMGLNPSLENFFKDFFDPGFEQRYQRASLGSGVIIDGKVFIILIP